MKCKKKKKRKVILRSYLPKVETTPNILAYVFLVLFYFFRHFFK